ncbi:hypothetical protein BJX63DRAFT_394118 [Aspergillus granulosus]|uniref:F-box domain-containing protein n=1 Tax=Aspergillus granulosus TaxID=176169 RepID=A0ABR4HEF7_9EURO
MLSHFNNDSHLRKLLNPLQSLERLCCVLISRSKWRRVCHRKYRDKWRRTCLVRWKKRTLYRANYHGGGNPFEV